MDKHDGLQHHERTTSNSDDSEEATPRSEEVLRPAKSILHPDIPAFYGFVLLAVAWRYLSLPTQAHRDEVALMSWAVPLVLECMRYMARVIRPEQS